MIWLTGSGGLLGSELRRQLGLAGLEHSATGRAVDIGEAEAVSSFARACRPDWIVNCAAYTAVDRAEAEDGEARRVNALGPANLARAAAGVGAGLLHLSTDYVFDGLKQGGYTEEDPPRPAGAYGRSKWEGERLAAALCPRTIIVRTSWLYGAGGPNFVRTMLRRFREGGPVPVVDDQLGCPTLADDLAGGLLAVLRAASPRPGLYHFANTGATSWHGFAVQIARLALQRGLLEREPEIRAIPTAEYPTAARRPANSVLLTDKFRRAFGLEIRGWREALADFMERL
jgi:dTDP-4-dehydrorhamnose reductase